MLSEAYVYLGTQVLITMICDVIENCRLVVLGFNAVIKA